MAVDHRLSTVEERRFSAASSARNEPGLQPRGRTSGIHWLEEFAMARKKKVKRFRAVTAVKELARERVGAPPAGQIVVEKKKKPEKHKPTLGKLLEGE
jgi:hypothetical protein